MPAADATGPPPAAPPRLSCTVLELRTPPPSSASAAGAPRSATVVVALGTRARVVSGVRVRAAAESGAAVATRGAALIFDDPPDSAAALSVTAVGLGAAVVPLRGLGRGGAPDAIDVPLLSIVPQGGSLGAGAGAGGGLVVRLLLSRSAAGPPAAVSALPRSPALAIPATATPPAAALPMLVPSPAPAPAPVLAAERQPAPRAALPQASSRAPAASVIDAATAAAAAAAANVGEALPARLVDYFGVMVAAPEEDEGEKEGEPPPRRQAGGILQFRRPKVDHADLALPENLDWFLFPDGIEAVLARRQPAPRSSAFALTDAAGLRMHCVCLTAFRRDEGGAGEGSGGGVEARWWPVVLFMLTRFPVVLELQRVLAAVFETFDAGAGGSGGGAGGGSRGCSYCSLDDYLRMLIFETPVPIRRMRLDVAVMLPALPATGTAQPSLVTFSLPPHDGLPLLQFSARRGALRLLPPAALARFLAAVALCKPIAVVARTAQELTELCEAALALVFPLQWEFGYVPLLPARMGDLLQSPSPVLTGLLSSYAARVFAEQGAAELDYLVVVDAVSGRVDVGTAPYLARNGEGAEGGITERDMDAALRASVDAAERGGGEEVVAGAGEYGRYPSAATVAVELELRLPDEVLRPLLAGLAQLAGRFEATTASYGRCDAEALRRENAPVQRLLARTFAALLHGYRAATFFPGLPPVFTPAFSAETFLASKFPLRVLGDSRSATGDGRAFYAALCRSQLLARLLQRHTSLTLRPFHALCAQLAAADCSGLPPRPTGVSPTCAARRTLVVPPPGAQSLAAWQHRAPLPSTSSLGDVAKSKRSREAGPRLWRSGAVAAALHLSPAEAVQLEALVAASRLQDANGPIGDDVGGDPESGDALGAAEISGDSSNAAVMSQRLLAWSARCFAGIGGLPTESLDTALISPLGRATFLRILQAQVLLSCGCRSVVGSELLQSMLGLGAGLASEAASAPFLVLHGGAFTQLVATCRALLAESSADGDFVSAGALLQVSAAVRCSTAARSARMLSRALADEPVWRQLAFWSAHVEEVKSVSAAVTESSASNVARLLAPMRELCVTALDVRALASRVCARARADADEERVVLALVEGALAPPISGAELEPARPVVASPPRNVAEVPPALPPHADSSLPGSVPAAGKGGAATARGSKEAHVVSAAVVEKEGPTPLEVVASHPDTAADPAVEALRAAAAALPVGAGFVLTVDVGDARGALPLAYRFGEAHIVAAAAFLRAVGLGDDPSAADFASGIAASLRAREAALRGGIAEAAPPPPPPPSAPSTNFWLNWWLTSM